MKAYLDTTVLVDVLLNTGDRRQAARAALAKSSVTILPVYAIKELKAGALTNFVWFHNKVAQFPLAKALQALQQSALSPKRYQTATAIQALMLSLTAAPQPLSNLVKKYGPTADFAEVARDRIRLSLKRHIKKAWKERRAITHTVVGELSCYTGEVPLQESPAAKTISLGSVTCPTNCCLTASLTADKNALASLSAALDQCPQKNETVKRKAVIEHLINKPNEDLLQSNVVR